MINFFSNIHKIILILFIFSIFIPIKKVQGNELFEIKAKKIEYNDTKNLIKANGNANAIHSSGKKIYADQILYYRNKNLIITKKNSKYIDGENILTANTFTYNANNKIIEARGNVVLKDKEDNKFFFDSFKYNENTQIGYGNEIEANISDGSFLSSKKIILNKKNNITNLNDAKFTTCSNAKNDKNEFCPSWSLNSKKIIHDKNKKKVTHKNAVLKLKKIPVFYSPYISHPDPSVKRQSGFLPPMAKTLTNIGRTIQIPYFWAINDDKDLTLTPTYYSNEYDLLRSSYRQVFKNGSLIIENGYSKGYKNLNKTGRTKGARNYLFANYSGDIPSVLFYENQIEFKLQRVSQQNFLRVNKINTKLFKNDIRSLENSIQISGNDSNKRFSTKIGIFENLDISDNSKYTYYLPDGVFSLNKKFANFNSNFNTLFQGKKFLKNQKQFKIRNNILLNSKGMVFKNNGISSVAKLSLYNNNIYNDNVTNQKDNTNVDNYFTFALDNTLPFAKFSKNSYQTLTPRVFLKYTSGKMLNAYDSEKLLNFSDVFSMNRTNNLDTPEVGASIGHGFDYTFNKSKKNSNFTKVTTSLGLGQVLRKDREKLMPNKSSLNNSSSDIVGYFKYSLNGDEVNLNIKNKDKISFLNNFKNNNLTINHNFNIENDFSEMVSNNTILSGSYNKLYTALKFEEKNNHVGSEKSGSINIKKLIGDNYYFNFESKRNLKTNNSEYLKFGINFENDCILSSLTLSRDFYFDKDITSSKTLIFGITIKPFSDNFGPDLTDLIN